MGEKRNVCMLLMGKPEEKRPTRRDVKLVDNIVI
jgi:hypothetical protein